MWPEFLQYILLWAWSSDDAHSGTLRVIWGKGCHGVNRAAKNESSKLPSQPQLMCLAVTALYIINISVGNKGACTVSVECLW